MPEASDDDLANVNPGFPKAAAGFALLAGAVAILNGLQTLIVVRILSPAWSVAPYAHLLLGAALVVLARSVFLARLWAAFGAIAAGALLAIASGGWLWFAVTNGFIALYAMWTPLAALLAVAMCAAAVPACERATRARKRLAADGMDIGL